MSAGKASGGAQRAAASSPDRAALDALAAVLAPRVAKLLREQSIGDADLRELLADSGFELDNAPAGPERAA